MNGMFALPVGDSHYKSEYDPRLTSKYSNIPTIHEPNETSSEAIFTWADEIVKYHTQNDQYPTGQFTGQILGWR